MPDTTLDPQAIAKAVAIEVADEDNQVGDFVEAIDLGVTSPIFVSRRVCAAMKAGSGR